MVKTRLLKDRLARLARCGALVLLVFGVAHRGSAQSAAAQATVSTPPPAPKVSAGVATTVVQTPPPNIATPAQETGSPHLIARTGPPLEEVNRKALEENAGKDAANILMRSSPSGAQIYINGAFVGHTPLLLNVAPGKYKVEMRGQRDDFAETTVGLLAGDTQKITLTLSARYPNRVSMR
jgi:hypothetical protein